MEFGFAGLFCLMYDLLCGYLLLDCVCLFRVCAVAYGVLGFVCSLGFVLCVSYFGFVMIGLHL